MTIHENDSMMSVLFAETQNKLQGAVYFSEMSVLLYSSRKITEERHETCFGP